MMTREPTEEERRREATSYGEVEPMKERAPVKPSQEPKTLLVGRPSLAPESTISIEQKEPIMKEESRYIPIGSIETEAPGEREPGRTIRVETTRPEIETLPKKPTSIPIYSIPEEEDIYEIPERGGDIFPPPPPPSQYQQGPGPQLETTPVKPVAATVVTEQPVLSIPPITIEPERKKPSISVEQQVPPPRKTEVPPIEPTVSEKKVREPRRKVPKEIPPLTIQTRGRGRQPPPQPTPSAQAPTSKAAPTTTMVTTRTRPSRGGKALEPEPEPKPTTIKRETQPKKPAGRKRGRARRPQVKSKRLREETTTAIPIEREAEMGEIEEEEERWEEQKESVPVKEVPEPSSSVTMALAESKQEEEEPIPEKIQPPSSQGNIKK
jgi:hypothetical protein